MQNAGCPPSYAILSHTWGNGEVSLQQYQIWRGLLTDPFFDNNSSIEDEISSGGFIIHGLDDAWESRIDEQIKGATKIAQGLVKILRFAKEVFIAGHDSYIWVETCCIDKTSSAELFRTLMPKTLNTANCTSRSGSDGAGRSRSSLRLPVWCFDTNGKVM
ncbi:hypothetical protein BKA67DRAFT_571450 [Truncatella angustata]|uniref:Heterokaryon incompatibility domain-containing protein n=1 Tax=Truncatella angustata TaxID=152316 RepID=A0A9P8UG37_9PEZI|nr:uncharacterized protein BKA67DRAFT_571450 [Truncatella angustata]KAH6651637.1 hypothetical protein BKA67DRAFT_571450 [Truncatella angustata]